MPSHFEKRVVPYTPEQMFKLVADVEHYPSFLPWCLSAMITPITENSFKALLRVGHGGFHDTFTSIVRLTPHSEINVHYGGGPLKTLENRWQFAPTENNGCEISFYVSFSMKSVFFGKMMDLFFDHAFRKMVGAFEKQAHTLYGNKQ